MEILKYKMVFMDFYSAVLGSFYSTEEKSRILKLIAIASDIDKKEIPELIEAHSFIEREGIDTQVGSNNFLLVAFFSKDLSPILYNAALALYELFSSKKNKEAYSNEMLWRRSIIRENNPLDIGYYEYARNNLDRSIDAFERLKRSNKKLPISEYLAQLYNEAENYEKAYEYALESQCVKEGEKLEIPWLLEIEQQCKDKLPADKANRIEQEILYKKNSPSRIGF